jgi:hypothetical protein
MAIQVALKQGMSRKQMTLPRSNLSIIYFENGHFTERVITCTGMVWFHDGMFTGRSLLYETNNMTSINILNHAVMAFYARNPIENL